MEIISSLRYNSKYKLHDLCKKPFWNRGEGSIFLLPQINWQLCSIAFVNIINEEARDLLGGKRSGVDKEHTTISYPREIFNVSFSYFILSRARINRIVWISIRNFTYTSMIFIRLLKLRWCDQLTCCTKIVKLNRDAFRFVLIGCRLDAKTQCLTQKLWLIFCFFILQNPSRVWDSLLRINDKKRQNNKKLSLSLIKKNYR